MKKLATTSQTYAIKVRSRYVLLAIIVKYFVCDYKKV